MSPIADIDWLTVVFPDGWRLQPLDSELPMSAWKPRSGGYGYDRGGLDDITGMTMFWSTWRKGMGTCYVLPAKTLAKVAELLASASYLFSALRLGFDLATATRVDVRIDIEDKGVSAYEFADSVDNGSVECTARRKYIYRGVNKTPGLTVYLGSKASSSFVRVYDKNAESGGDKPYTRVEVQSRGQRARRAWLALAACKDTAEASEAIASIIAAHVQFFGVPILDAIVAGELPFDFKADKHPEKDTWRWLMNQVLPSFKRDAIVHQGDPQLWRAFSSELMKQLERK